MVFHDIVPSVHGRTGKLRGPLARVAHARRDGRWRHDGPARRIVSQGDGIDGGPDGRSVLGTVPDLIPAGRRAPRGPGRGGRGRNEHGRIRRAPAGGGCA